MPSVAVLLSLLSVQLSPIDFAPTPLQVSHTPKRKKKALFFLRKKERDRKLYSSLYCPAADTKAGRRTGEARGELGEGAEGDS